MGDKKRQRTEQWEKRQITRFITKNIDATVQDYNFKRLKALGIIKEG